MVKRHIKNIFVIVIMNIVIVCNSGCDDKEEATIEYNSNDSINITTENADTSINYIYVYITGAVQKPDVYRVKEGCRIYEIVNLAGGFLENADKKNINLADIAQDGMKIVIYEIGEETIVQNSESGLININTATKEELMELPGIGEAKAKSIIEYRKQNGGFKSINEIMNISGIKENAFNKIKEFITV